MIRVGIITEKNGPHLGIYLKAIAECEGVAKAAICDESGAEFGGAETVLKRQYGDVPAYRDSAKMFAEFKPGFIIVTLPAHVSPPAIRAALEAGCHVLSEKPGCVRAEQFAELAKLAKSKELNLMLSLPTRVNAGTLRAREIVRRGFLGKLYAINVLEVKDQSRLTSPSYQKSWFAFKDKAAGGHLIWLGIHQMDQIPFITGDKVERVTAFCRNVGGQPIEVEDAETVSMQFKSGMVGTFHGGYYLPGGSLQSEFSIWGSKGWLRITTHRGPEGTNSSFEWRSTHEKAPGGIQAEEPKSKTGGYEGFVQAAVDAARGVKPVPLTAEDSLAVLKVIFAAYRSSESGRAEKVE